MAGALSLNVRLAPARQVQYTAPVWLAERENMGKWNDKRTMLERYLSETMTLAKDRLPGQLGDWRDSFRDSSFSGAQNLVSRLLEKLQEGIVNTAAESSTLKLKSALKGYFEGQASKMIQQECEDFAKDHLTLFCKQITAMVYDPLPLNVTSATGGKHEDPMGIFESFDEGAGQELAIAGGVMFGAVGVGVGAFVFGIGAIFFGLIPVINFLVLIPLLVAALFIGTASGGLAAKAKSKAVGRILAKIEPQLSEAIVGKGFESNGQHHDSLLSQVQGKMDEITDKSKSTIRPLYEQFRDQSRAGFEEVIRRASEGDGTAEADLDNAVGPTEIAEVALKYAPVPHGLRFSEK